MRGLNSESVDLIYLNPPFNRDQDYAAPIGSSAEVPISRTSCSCGRPPARQPSKPRRAHRPEASAKHGS